MAHADSPPVLGTKSRMTSRRLGSVSLSRRWCCIGAERLGMVHSGFRSHRTLCVPPAHSCRADYRHSVSWRYAALYIWNRSRDTTTDSFTTAEHIVDVQVKRVW
jgi:hypothetical protein